MTRVLNLRDQEAVCRERAQRDGERRAFWSAEAEAWQRIALDEIAATFRHGQRRQPELEVLS
jgi:hypothetical protein